MKIVRWLLCHTLIIIILTSFVLIYVFRDTLKNDVYRLTGNAPATIEAEADQRVEDDDSGHSHRQVPAESQTLSGNEEETRTVSPAINDSEEKRMPVKAYESKSGTRSGYQNSETSDPWGRVISRPDADQSNISSSDNDEERKADVPRSADTSFPPDDYDPELASSSQLNAFDNSKFSSTNLNAGEMQSSSALAFEKIQTEVQSKPENKTVRNDTNEATVQHSARPDYFAALEEARRLYWNGKMGIAQSAYEKLMFEYPDMPEAAAELGNLLLQQGNRNGAAWAYQNAIPRYLKLHREQEAISLTEFVSQYDPAIAESLQKKYW